MSMTRYIKHTLTIGSSNIPLIKTIFNWLREKKSTNTLA